MKNIKSLLLLSLFVGAGLLLNNCGKESIAPDAKELQKDIQFSDYEIEEILLEAEQTLENPEIYDATEETDLNILNDGIPLFLTDDDNLSFDGRTNPSALKKGRCDSLWFKLALTDTQKNQVRRAHTAYMNCKNRAQTALRQLYQSYFKRAAAERAKLIQAYKNGRITRAQLARKLQDLNKKVRAAIKADQQRIALVKALKDCHAKYLRTLKSILTPQQWATLMKCKRVLYKKGKTGNGGKGTGTTFDCPRLQVNYGDLCKDALGNVGRINKNCACDTSLVRKGGGNTGGGKP